AFGNVGGSRKAGLLGTLGDVGIVSFGRGKPLTLLSGGAAVTGSQEIRAAMDVVLQDRGRAGCAGQLARAAAYWFFFHPRRYWLASHLPGLGLGKSPCPGEVEIGGMSRFHTTLGAIRLSEYEPRRQARARRGRWLAGMLRPLEVLGEARLGRQNAWLRLPVLVGASERHRLLGRLRHLGATAMYPLPLNEQADCAVHLRPEVARRSYPHARRLSRCLITLPLHDFLGEPEALAIRSALLSPGNLREEG
ncbi:MAG: DegT/DnrJ/EryC1/StrS family aminotransferase, partial [Pseudomonadota bacterium]